MAQTTKRKTTAKKKPASKKKTSKKKNKNLFDIVLMQEISATLIFVLGLITLIVAVLAGGENSLWNEIHRFYYDTLGLSGIFIPFMLLFSGIVKVMNKQKTVHYVKEFEFFILTVCISGFLFINNFADPSIVFSDALGEIYNTHAGLKSGGITGALIGGSFYYLTGSKVVANIIEFILTAVSVMFLFRITLFKLFTNIEKPARKVGEYTGEVIEKTREDYENHRKEREAEKAQRDIPPLKTNDQQRKERADKSSRQKKRSSVSIDPTQIVNDFFAAGDKKEEKAVNKEEKEKSSEKSAANQDTETGFSQKSIFDMPFIKNKKNSVEVPEVNNDIISSDVNGDSSDGAASSVAPEHLDPLSPEEKAELNSELDEAVGQSTALEYSKPPLECLNLPDVNKKNADINELKNNGDKLIAALQSFNVSASIVDVVPGPTVTRYELSPAPGVKISKFIGLSDDLALHMAAPAGLRIEAPIPNKAAIGIEIPNKNKTTVTFREIIDTDKFRNAKSRLNVALGKDIAGEPVYSDLAKMPHLLVAGTTGSGKSVCLNTMIVSLLYNATPDEVKILLIDPKQVEFGVYDGLPHLLVPVVSDPRKASGALGWAVTEMLSRYKTLNANGVRDIGAYNSLCDERDDLVKMPQIVIFIDELSDLMTVAPAEVEDSIQRLAQMARAAGMHLVVATQRPSVDVITGVIKANIPSRIALTVKSQIDSRTIIDSAGAEKLMGYGDMLYYPVGVPKPIRVQGSYLTDGEIERVVEYIKSNGTAQYDDAVQQEIEKQAAAEKKKGVAEDTSSKGIDSGDDLLNRAIELFVGTPEKASISALQRHLGLGFAKAGRLMDTLEEKGIVGPHEGSKPRKVLITKSQWYEMNAMNTEVVDIDAMQNNEDDPSTEE